MHWSQTESSKCSLNCLLSNLSYPFTAAAAAAAAVPSTTRRQRSSGPRSRTPWVVLQPWAVLQGVPSCSQVWRGCKTHNERQTPGPPVAPPRLQVHALVSNNEGVMPEESVSGTASCTVSRLQVRFFGFAECRAAWCLFPVEHGGGLCVQAAHPTRRRSSAVPKRRESMPQSQSPTQPHN